MPLAEESATEERVVTTTQTRLTGVGGSQELEVQLPDNQELDVQLPDKQELDVQLPDKVGQAKSQCIFVNVYVQRDPRVCPT